MTRWGVAIAALLALAGCSSASRDGLAAATPSEPRQTVPDSADPVPGLSAEAVQLRTDAAVGGRIHVRVTASDTFTVTSVALESPGFAPLPPRELATDFVPGRVIDLRTPLGRARCDMAPQPASARLTVVRPGAGPEQVVVPLAAAVLEDIHTDECVEQSLARAVTIRLADLRDDGDGLAGSLQLVRESGDRAIRVVALRRSVLVAVEADLPLTLAADAADASTVVRLTPATCEPHVLAETKQPFLFPLTVEVGDADAVTVDLPIPDDVRARLQALVQRVCR